MRERSRAVALSILLLVFAVGGLAGMAVEEGLGLDWFDFLDEDQPGEAISGDEDFLLRLDLTADQRERIEQIFEQQDDQLETYWREHLPAIRSIVAASDTRIDSVLTPAQRTQYHDRIRSRGDGVPEPGID